MTKKIKLVISGSGFPFPVFVGAILRLAEEDMEIAEVCATSGGAIVAAALASGYRPNKDLIKLIKQTLPMKNKLLDFSIWSLITKWGLLKGDSTEAMFNKYFVKTMNEAKIPIHIVATNLDKREMRIFSSSTDPGLSMAKVVRASMSIPALFAPVIIDGQRYVDGGLSSNYYLNMFGTGKGVIGLKFKIKRSKAVKISNAINLIMSVVDYIIDLISKQHMSEAIYAKTIIINSNYEGLKYDIIDQDVDNMVLEGWKATDEWIKNHKQDL